jgi:hypothetical protein
LSLFKISDLRFGGGQVPLACLKFSKNPDEIALAKKTCTEYLTKIMRGVRFGIAGSEQRAKPFCLPPGDLTDEQTNLIRKRFVHANPALQENDPVSLADIMTERAYRCGKP